MKKLASIVGIGVLSMAVGLAPAFAQSKPPEPAGGTVTKADEKAPATSQAVKDTKSIPAKAASDVKATTTAPAADLKKEAATVKPSDDKTRSLPAKAGAAVKEEKSAPVKPGVEMKNEKAPVASGHSKAHEGTNLKEGKVTTSKSTEKAGVAKPDADKKLDKSTSTPVK